MNKYFFTLFALTLLLPNLAGAAISDDVVTLAPDRQEILLVPGESATRILTVSNNSAKTQTVTVAVEDFMAGDKATDPVKLLGDEHGTYSLRDYLLIKPTDLNFRLLPGEQRRVTILVQLPAGLPAGGYYAAPLLSFRALGLAGEQVSVTNRLGSLFFVRIRGDINEAGALKEFGWFDYQPEAGGPLRFAILYENHGDIYLNPYGYIEVRNRLTGFTTSTPVAPWFVLPRAVRQQEILWPLTLSSGFYQAKLFLNRGYGNVVDEANFNFVAGKKFILIYALIILAIVVFIFGYKLKQ